jgi:hypothetical protein
VDLSQNYFSASRFCFFGQCVHGSCWGFLLPLSNLAPLDFWPAVIFGPCAWVRVFLLPSVFLPAGQAPRSLNFSDCFSGVRRCLTASARILCRCCSRIHFLGLVSPARTTSARSLCRPTPPIRYRSVALLETFS